MRSSARGKDEKGKLQCFPKRTDNACILYEKKLNQHSLLCSQHIALHTFTVDMFKHISSHKIKKINPSGKFLPNLHIFHCISFTYCHTCALGPVEENADNKVSQQWPEALSSRHKALLSWH